MFYLRLFVLFLLPRLSCSEASVCFTDPPLSSLWSLAIFAYLMAIMQTAGAGLELGWAGLPPDLLQTEHPEHAATVTRAYSHPLHIPTRTLAQD